MDLTLLSSSLLLFSLLLLFSSLLPLSSPLLIFLPFFGAFGSYSLPHPCKVLRPPHLPFMLLFLQPHEQSHSKPGPGMIT